MRVALIANPYIPVPPIKYGGTEKVIFYLIKGLKEAGHEPLLVGPGDSTVDCEVIPTTEKSIFFPKTRGGLAAFEQEVRRIDRRTVRIIKELLPRVDILHSHDFDLRPFQNFPNLTTLHGPIEFKNIKTYLAKSRRYLNYVSISHNQQAVLPQLNYLGVAYNGEDPDEFPLENTPDNYVVFVGRFDREKNPHHAIQLAISYGVKIKLAGKIDFLGDEYFKTEIKPYLKHPLVEYLGEISPKEVMKLVSKAKCNLHPTNFREPFGLTVLEAAYCGTPTVAVQRGSMPELIEDGRTGILVEDFVEGYSRLEECFTMDRSYIAQRARMLFNYHTMTNSYTEAYERAIRLAKERQQRASILKLVDKLPIVGRTEATPRQARTN